MKRDDFVVLTSDLTCAVEAWIAKHRARFPQGQSKPCQGEIAGYGAISYLADNMTVGTWRTRYNRIERIRKGLTQTTDLRVADEILTAMGDIHLLDNEIPVYPREKFYTNGMRPVAV